MWRRLDATEKEEDSEYLNDFEEIIKTNRVVRELNVNNDQLREEKLRPE